ncbi:MAG: peptide chain release factor N(5)-glutamine methyltransferase [Campylobacteraceae bacterium]|nr:peptide chain release factor N(5)-glutamine methyltransferase [Campylobacteraceae bacterium]MBT4030244.1 peptide chain release factor N(5)-glutamine methyltransferase [Campylobacteraceae bacterium]MBT4179502.1 peptide chain release factor N(5)-glutamine methyltransferase [Campylobacteraceae bacterium]MBT4572453.1 peptide chain release factor N(5)-glutamine methyltransferase [Campylobacteraceae bacterium]MBT4707380.1 peptide chain release factor N(5)-glutamine methyltransferase [Campylobacter
MATYKEVIKTYSRQLKDITHIPQKEVEILLLSIVKQNVIWLHINYNEQCTCEAELNKLVEKRATHYPIEYITSRASFYGEVFNVQDGVLIPRPETEILVEKAEAILKTIDSPKIIEIGTGSGIISVMLALLIDDISIIAVDINDKALELAKSNAIKHGVEDKITFIKSDLYNEISNDEKFDMCVSNPPYIADNFKLERNVMYEPSNALFGGNRGDELLENIITQTANRNIKYLYCEMGYDQKKPLTKFINQFNIKELEFYEDLAKLDRGFTLEFKQ